MNSIVGNAIVSCYMDAAAIEDHDGNMRLIHVNEHIMEIFELVGFMDIVKVEES